MTDARDRLNVVTDSTLAEGAQVQEFSVVDEADIGRDSTVWRFCNLYGCEIGAECMVGSNVEIQSNATVGDRSRVQSHSFVCSRVDIGTDVFVGHGVMFINDTRPPSPEQEWESTTIRDGASIGSNATLLPVKVGANAMVGAGAVVTEDVPPNAVVAGNPAEVVGTVD